MGCDCTNFFPPKTNPADVEEFLLLLGFQRGTKGAFTSRNSVPFHYFKDEHYRHITGLYAELARDKDNPSNLKVWTRTTIWRSKFDSDFHNFTIKQLKKRFGGYFISDSGRNRYLKFDGPVREKSEAGAYEAYNRFHSSTKRADHFIHFAKLLDDETYKIQGIDFIDALNPRILSANVMVPFLVSAIEDYFRSLYIALLRYSHNRERIVQNARLQGAELNSIDKGELTVPEAVAKWMSFQDLGKINAAFKDLDKNLDLHGILKRPYGRLKLNFWDSIDGLIKQRHALIHHAELDASYRPEKLKRDLKCISKAVGRRLAAPAA